MDAGLAKKKKSYLSTQCSAFVLLSVLLLLLLLRSSFWSSSAFCVFPGHVKSQAARSMSLGAEGQVAQRVRTFDFCAKPVRQIVYSTLPPSQRSVWHLKTAQATTDLNARTHHWRQWAAAGVGDDPSPAVLLEARLHFVRWTASTHVREEVCKFQSFTHLPFFAVSQDLLKMAQRLFASSSLEDAWGLLLPIKV